MANKKLPLDRYPYMENDIKKRGDTPSGDYVTQEDFDTYKDEVTGELREINDDITEINNKMKDDYGFYKLEDSVALRKLFGNLSFSHGNVNSVWFTYCNHMVTLYMRFTLDEQFNNNDAFSLPSMNSNTLQARLSVLNEVNITNIQGVKSSLGSGLIQFRNNSGETITSGTKMYITHVYPTDTTADRIEELFSEYKVTT